MSAVLTAEQALKLVGEMFVYHMPFNRALGMELERYEKEFAQLAFKNQPMMVGNWAQSILHGGVIASALDVAAKVSAQDGAAIRVGLCQFNQRNGARNGLNSAGTCANDLVKLFAGGFGAVGIAHNFQRNLQPRRQ